MINWAKVRFLNCRVCNAMLSDSDLAQKHHDLCLRCTATFERWVHKKCRWELKRVVVKRTPYLREHTITETEAYETPRHFITSNNPPPYMSGDYVEICTNRRAFLTPNEVLLAEWVAMQLKRMAKNV